MGWSLLLAGSAADAAIITLGPGCSLVEAIDAANADIAVGTCTAGSGADAIVLVGSVSLAIFDNTTDGDNGLPSIATEITVEGRGFTIERDPAAPAFRLFHIGETGDLTLRDVTVSGGLAKETGNSDRGGGIFNRGALTLDATRIVDNVASSRSAYGGGIYSLGSLTLRNRAIVRDNLAEAGDSSGSQAWGGGIYAQSGSLDIDESFIESNEAISSGFGAAGGGLSFPDLVPIITRSSITDNLAVGVDFATGGGLHGGILVVEESTLSGNRTIATLGQSAGGAMYFGNYMSGEARVINTTISGNSAQAATVAAVAGGGGIYNWIDKEFGRVDLVHVTMAGNTVVSPSANVANAVANRGWVYLLNSVSTDGCVGVGVSVWWVDGVNFGCAGLTDPEPVTGLDPVLRANGGPTRTHALSVGSNAVNAAGSCADPTDQRGVSRLAGCDSGAYEYNPCTWDDPLENAGAAGGDDSCNGANLVVGVQQTHLHCDPDYVWFNLEEGKTYELKTTDLVGGADTELDLFASICGPGLASDDDGGLGPASRIVYTADSNGPREARVAQSNDSYNPGSNPPASVEGYGILLTCIENCECSPPEGPDLDLVDDAVSTVVTYEACSTVTATNWAVEPGGNVALRAGEAIIFANGVVIDGLLAVEVDPGLLPP